MGHRRHPGVAALALLLFIVSPVVSAQRVARPTGETVGAMLERARVSLDAVLARDPESAEAQYLLGVIAERRKDLTAAAASYQLAIRYAPTMAKARDRLGFVLGQLGRTG